MKKTIIYFLLSLWAAQLAAQSSFPVQVTNQYDPVPSWAYNSGQKNNAYTIQYVTRSQVEAATNTSIGHLYALTGNPSPQPGKALVIRGFTIASTKPVTMQIRVGTPTGVLAVANIPEMDLGILADSTPQYIPVNWVIRNVKSTFIYCLNFMRAADTAAWITITPDCYNVADDFNYDARKGMQLIGTSISNGTGASLTGNMYQTLLKDTLRDLGVSIRYEINAISGSTTATHEPFFRQGAYDRLQNGKAPDLVVIELAVNDASAGTPSATYTARLRYFAERFLKMPENTKTIVLILGATPLGNTTAYNNSVMLDAAASSLVTTLKGIYPNRIFFVPCADAFPRTDRQYYISSDAVGAEIHPNDLGNRMIMNNKIAPFIASAEGQIVVNALK